MAVVRFNAGRRLVVIACAMIAVFFAFGAASEPEKYQNPGLGGGRFDWPSYGGDPANHHYSPLVQINRENVKRLAVAWSFDTQEEGGLQSTPIVVDGVLYGITPTQKIFALDAATGRTIWKFDSGVRGTQPDRGLAFWSDVATKDATKKDRRILVGVMN